MRHRICRSREELGHRAAEHATSIIVDAIERTGKANIVLATGLSQFATLDALVNSSGIDWSAVTAFHLDEYVGIDENHPASFRRYLRERFEERVSGLRAFNYIDGTADTPEEECRRLSELIRRHPIDVALVGIGENGHLAFNDPPADFDTREPYILVELTQTCREQQVGEGWFENTDLVPQRAISMSVQQIMSARHLVASVPDRRKAEAVRCTLEGPVNNNCPASILQRHKRCNMFLDEESASLLSQVPPVL